MYEILRDEPEFLVVNKPAGTATEDLPDHPVHRLDKDTSGVMVLAKTENAKDELQQLFKLRKVRKTYLALVLGRVEPATGEWLDRLSRGRGRMYGTGLGGRVAKLTYTVRRLLHLGGVKAHPRGDPAAILTLLELELVTGRTHQIRVQAKAHRYPIIGDQLYRTKISRDLSNGLGLSRQFLHAKRIEFTWHNKLIVVESPLPADLQAILDRLK